MKRSEILELMNTVLNERIGSYKNHGVENDILDALEKAGMLAPSFYDEDDCTFISVANVLDCGNLDGKFMWEPEDD